MTWVLGALINLTGSVLINFGTVSDGLALVSFDAESTISAGRLLVLVKIYTSNFEQLQHQPQL